MKQEEKMAFGDLHSDDSFPTNTHKTACARPEEEYGHGEQPGFSVAHPAHGIQGLHSQHWGRPSPIHRGCCQLGM